MKKVFCIFFVCVAVICCKAQPNGGFENWTTVFNSPTPDGWQTLNFLTITTPPNPVSAFKATGVDVHSGNYALKLKTIHVSTNPVPQLIDDTMGVIFTGKINISAGTYKYGFPLSSRPKYLEFWAKYLPVGGDSAGVRVVLRKWNGIKTDTVAEGTLSFGETVSYTLFKAELNYYSNVVPDSALIIYGSSRHRLFARINSTLFLDDVLFTGSVGIDDHKAISDRVKVFPNPAKDNVTIQVEIKEADNIEITDISGKAIGIYKIENPKVNVTTALYLQGTYFYTVRDKQNKVLTTGKFNVIK
ncbi:MAG: T9SS type A sorting domain-containing protein [Bacteroidota bacterium]